MKRFWLKLFGDRGERAAARFLKKRGHVILARQYRNRLGEIDLITRDGSMLVFVEVKTRRSSKAGDPRESVTVAKQKQMTRLASAFLKSHNLQQQPARFDVVSVIWPENQRVPEILHVENAFPAR